MRRSNASDNRHDILCYLDLVAYGKHYKYARVYYRYSSHNNVIRTMHNARAYNIL